MPRAQPAAPRRRPSLDFSLTGLLYCGMMMFMGLAAVNTQANLLFGVFGLMIGVLLVAAMISRTVLRKLRVRRVLPDHAVVGEPVPVQYEFTNAKRFWPSLSVTLSELDATGAFDKQPVAYMLHAAPRMTAAVPLEVVPRRRGLHVLDRFQLSTSFPFGFIKRAVNRHERDTILVFPPIAKVDPRLLGLCRSADQAGAPMRPRRGGDDEFYGLKEYRAGENPRRIHWRRSAHTGVLVVKEMTQVSPPKLVLLVDTYARDRSPASLGRVERAIATAASLAAHALDAGLMVGLFAWGRPEVGADPRPASRAPDYESPPGAPEPSAVAAAARWLAIPPNRGKRHGRDLLAYLAQLPRNDAQDTGALLDASRGFYATSSPVLLTPQDVQAGVTDQGRSSMVVLSVGNPNHQRYFTFDPAVDFERCMPGEQDEAVDAKVDSVDGAKS